MVSWFVFGTNRCYNVRILRGLYRVASWFWGFGARREGCINVKVSKRSIIACPECDLLLFGSDLSHGCTAVCRRCGATLYRATTDSAYRTLALALAAAIFFIIANIYPILGIEAQGNANAASLFGAVNSLWNQQMHFISALVLITAIVIPALQIALLIYVLFPLKYGFIPPGLSAALRFLRGIGAWGMLDVFMLSILVALVKLMDNFQIVPGLALWSFGALTFLMAAVSATFNPRDVWACLDARENSKGAP